MRPPGAVGRQFDRSAFPCQLHSVARRWRWAGRLADAGVHVPRRSDGPNPAPLFPVQPRRKAGVFSFYLSRGPHRTARTVRASENNDKRCRKDTEKRPVPIRRLGDWHAE
jgi:hypothetical protein